jgi:hypothetical protein
LRPATPVLPGIGSRPDTATRCELDDVADGSDLESAWVVHQFRVAQFLHQREELHREQRVDGEILSEPIVTPYAAIRAGAPAIEGLERSQELVAIRRH